MARRLVAGWTASLQALGGAFGEVVRAELAALGDDLSRSGRRLAAGLLLFAGALFAGFWALGLAVYLAVEVAGRWLPRWGAVAAVLGLVLLIAALLAALGWHRFRRLESPAVTLRRRWTGHRDWWLEQFPAARGGAGPRRPPDAEVDGGGAS